jgi:hypothetical protein
MKNLLAQSSLPLAPSGGFSGALNGKGLLAAPGNGIDIFAKFLSSVIGLLTIIAVIWFVFTFITGAIGMIGAGSDKTALENSRKKIINGVTGLVVTIIAIFVISLVGYLLGFKNILDLRGMYCSITTCP